jgi:hypothetical protein
MFMVFLFEMFVYFPCCCCCQAMAVAVKSRISVPYTCTVAYRRRLSVVRRLDEVICSSPAWMVGGALASSLGRWFALLPG